MNYLILAAIYFSIGLILTTKAREGKGLFVLFFWPYAWLFDQIRFYNHTN